MKRDGSHKRGERGWGGILIHNDNEGADVETSATTADYFSRRQLQKCYENPWVSVQTAPDRVELDVSSHGGQCLTPPSRGAKYLTCPSSVLYNTVGPIPAVYSLSSRSFAIRSSNTFSKTPFVGHSIHEWVTLFSKPVKCAVIRTVVEEPCELAKNDRTARPASHVPKMFEGRCAYSLRTISDISPAPTFRGSVVINPFVLSIVLITANDEISETKTPHTLSNPA